MNGQETEAKFYVANLAGVDEKLTGLGARLIQLRAHESNLRFDTPDRSLQQKGEVLRLRQDEHAWMTFKSGSSAQEGIVSRKEIEFGVESFATARELIESLGYEVIFFYEKYRTTYEINELHIMLDELPYGDFVEIEGEDGTSIRDTATRLGLHWEAAITSSYSALFERVAKPLRLDPNKLTFEAFAQGKPRPKDLAVRIADE